MQVKSPQRMPVVFVSHGAPTLAIEDGEAHRFLRTYGEQLGRPGAILVLSAHFAAPVATVTAAKSPDTIHDFGGFPQELHEMTYPVPGSPELAGDVQALLTAAGVQATSAATRGLDHGAWIPLVLMYPEADVPVVQLSLDPRRGAAYHVELGRHLAPLRDQGVLIIGSGGVTHNLRELEWGGTDVPVPEWASSFNEWVAEAIAASDAFSVAGGGDTLAAIDKYGVRDGISYISTGGGAFLEFVEGKALPAVTRSEERFSRNAETADSSRMLSSA